MAQREAELRQFLVFWHRTKSPGPHKAPSDHHSYSEVCRPGMGVPIPPISIDAIVLSLGRRWDIADTSLVLLLWNPAFRRMALELYSLSHYYSFAYCLLCC